MPTGPRRTDTVEPDPDLSDPDHLERVVRDLVDRTTLRERLSLMSGDGPLVRGTREMARRYNAVPVVAGELPRLGLPGIRFTDGPRGVVMGAATAFPSSTARGATFDPDLEVAVGDVIGVEGRSLGANLFAGVCVNLLRHPAWGRAQETYGEDTELLGAMGVALTRGVRRHLLACVKHFALNSMENSRFWVDVRVDERDLHDIYLPHFRRVVDAGAEAVMSAYNGVNGSRSGHSRYLLTEVLKDGWGFDGFVMSDFTFGLHDAARAVNAGMDVEMPFRAFFVRLRGAVRSGRVPGSRVRDAATRVVRAQLRALDRGEPDRYGPDAVACPEHRALARTVASRGAVLLRNEPVGEGGPVLPLRPGAVRTLAVVGRLADVPNLGDLGSSQVHPPEVVTLLAGLEAAGTRHGVEVRHHDGADAAAAARLAADCDAAVVVVGTTHRDEGEWILRAGGDRASLRLRRHDEDLLGQVARRQGRTAAVLMGGSAFVTDRWHYLVPAVLMAWYPGMEGGHAVADLLWGDAEPQGRLPLTWPAGSTTLPPFSRFARAATYGPLHGYRLMEATGQVPSFPFGHGLGYAAVAWGDPEVVSMGTPGPDGRIPVTVAVDLTAGDDRDGVAVVQVYVPEVLGSHPDALRTLRGFRRVEVPAGASVRAEVVCSVPAGATEVWVGRSSAADDLVAVSLGT